MQKFRHSDHVSARERYSRGTTIDLHRHSVNQLVYCSTGVVVIGTPSGDWIGQPDNALWIPAMTPHRHRFHADATFHCVGFESAPRLLASTEPRMAEVSPLTRELIVACSDDTRGARYDQLRAVLVNELQPTGLDVIYVPTPTDSRVVAACAYVAANLDVPVCLAELAPLAGASERTLSRLFRSDMRMTFPQWRTRYRLHRALLLLAERKTVDQVAYRCGWSSASAFIAVFKQQVGVTPGQAFRTLDRRACEMLRR